MIHPTANEAAMRHLAGRLHGAELALAQAVGNLAWKDALLAERDAEIAELKKPKPRASTRKKT